VVVLTADESKEARERALTLGATDFLTKPFDRTEVALRVRNLLEMRELHLQLENQNQVLEERVRERTTELWTALQAIEKSEQDVRRSQAETVMRLSIAAEYRDDDTAQHIHRMSRYCEMLAEAAGIDPGTVELIRVASVMHDVGKIGIPDSILRKPARLTESERTAMEEHARIGYQILSGSDSELLQLAAEIALSHHERWDGTGYPEKRVGVDIPIAARIAAIADVFDAISTDRVYRKAMPFPKAMEIMRGGRSTHFDPDLLDVFFENIDKVLKIKKELEAAA
jgi:putative two-component system response regulator